MHKCMNCGKEFPFASKLVRHLNKKYPCSPNTFLSEKKEISQNVVPISQNVVTPHDQISQNVVPISQNVTQLTKNVTLGENFEKCGKCSKVLKNKFSLQRHMENCKGVNSLQCSVCLKVFSDRQSKYRHVKNCKSKYNVVTDSHLEEENQALRREIELLKASKGTTVNNTTNITNYIIQYNPETKCITSNDPNAPFPELLCFNGFKLEAARSKLKDIDQDTLQQRIDNVRLRKDFYSLYSFFFRNVDNSRLQMFIMGKNNNATHAQVFNNGTIEKMEKSQLFENVCRYIGQYLLNMSIENADVITMLTTEQASKNAFIEVTRDKSNIFNYYKEIV